MGRSTQVFLFGDQTNPFEAGLRKLLLRRENAILTSFFERTHFALRLEIGKLSAFERQLFPRFTSVGDLLAKYCKSGNNPALESAFTVLHQLGSFICYFSEGSRAYPHASETIVSGICTGLFAASAVSAAQSISELMPIAVDVVVLAFRTGLRATEVRDRIEQNTSIASSWSVVISGVQEASATIALREFSKLEGLPVSCQPYISAVSSSSLTLSGPPRVLERLVQSSHFSRNKAVRVAINAPYHASHLYAESDLDSLLETCTRDVIPRIPIISSVSGNEIRVPSYRALLRVVLAEVLVKSIRWDKMLEGVLDIVKVSAISHCIITPVATNAAQSLASALKEAGNQDVKVDNTIMSGLPSENLPTGRQQQSKIAIIGLSGRFPEAASLEAFWDILHQGLDVHREIPPDRFDVKTHVDLTGKKKNTNQVPHGCFINEPGLFDARFFNMSPKEAAQADPAQRLAMLTAYEALEMAGFVPDRTPSSQRDRVGVFYGTTSDDWGEVNSGQDVSTYFIPGRNRAFTPGRINYHFKFSGPSISVDTACSSSLAAIHTACNSLWQNDCDTAIAGGTNILTNPDNFTGLDKGHFLSRTGNCKTFDDGADGYCRSDSVGSVVMKRLEDALADGDPIQGVINGAYTNHSAEAESITRPYSGAQTFIFNKVLNDAGVDPLDVSYIEMHGTGTQAGDAVEMKSVLDVFASGRKKRDSRHTLHLGSAKANVGHGESASGVTALIKILLMMKANEIPPHCGIKTKINHNFPTDLEERGIRIAMKATPWERPSGGKRRTFLNNFSAAGGNTALLLEDAPIAGSVGTTRDPRAHHVVAVSAKSIPSLMQNVEALSGFLQANRGTSLSSLSYTTTARRIHHNHRVMVCGEDLQSIESGLKEALEAQRQTPVRFTGAPPIVFTFTGQGSQYAGKGKQLFQNFSQFRNDILRFDQIGKNFGFPAVQQLIEGTEEDSEVKSPLETQLGLTYLQMALARLWISWGAKPSAVIGHSLGEYAALHVAGVLSTSDTIYLVGKRAQLLQEQCTSGTHSMLAVKASAAVVRSLTGEKKFEFSCINGPDQTVISGTTIEVDEVYSDLLATGIKCTKLAVPFAFHSSQVQPILSDFEDVAHGATFHTPSIPVISPLFATVLTGSEINAKYLSRHCRETVDFQGALLAASAAKTVTEKSLFVEIGPDPVTIAMTKAVLGPKIAAAPSIRRNDDTWKVLTGSLSTLYSAGVDINWNEYHRDFQASHNVLHLPAYRWDYKNYWIQYVHDWCLTKGDPPQILPAPVPAAILPSKPKFSTTSVQSIIEEVNEDSYASVVMQSDVMQPDLREIFKAHKVNGIELCPSSVYADIAFTLGEYLQAFKPDFKHTAMSVCNMVVDKPLIAKDDGTPQYFRVSATADWATQTARLAYYSVNAEGKKTVDHAKCTVQYGNSEEWHKGWNRMSYLIRSRIGQLKKEVDNGESHKIKRGMAYRLFGAIVEYGQKFRGMDEVIINSSDLEATAQVTFQTTEKDKNFHTNPYWLDSTGHISGFIMNGSDKFDPKEQAFINHGWESWRYSKKLSPEKTYTTYAMMRLESGTMYIGDVYVFEDDQIVGCCQGVKFQGIPRRILDSVLPRPGVKMVASKPMAKPISVKPSRTEEIKQNTGTKTQLQSVSSNVPPPKGTSVVTKALGMVAEEIGIPLSDLTNESTFADFGVDSLLSLTLTGRFREELEIEVESSIFVDCPTVKDLKNFLSDKSPEANSSTTTFQEPLPSYDHSSASSVGQTTPSTYSDEESVSDGSISSLEDEVLNPMSSITLILAEEIGVSLDELRKSEDFPELGMDSLMSLTVLGRLREEVGMDLPSEFFTENSSLAAVELSLGFAPKSKAPRSSPTPIEKPPPVMQVSETPAYKKIPPATSILLQGNPKTASKTLFLFPDGSGSSTSYSLLPKIGSDIAVVGLNCPYMKTPQDLKCGLADITVPYVTEIQRRQPHGPYHFSGWSAGGVSAYDAAQYLMARGEKVASLILLDSPFPNGLAKLPPHLYHFLNSTGMFGSGDRAPPEWLLPHFMSFVEALHKYHAKPFAPGTAPKTSVIWAEDGVHRSTGNKRMEYRPDDPKVMRWLLENRSDFGPNKWDQLVGNGLVTETLPNANHFTMMEGQPGKQLADFIARAMA